MHFARQWLNPLSKFLNPASNEHQPGRAVNSFDHSELVSMKTLSGCKASCCDKHQFRDNEHLNHFRDIVEHSG